MEGNPADRTLQAPRTEAVETTDGGGEATTSYPGSGYDDMNDTQTELLSNNTGIPKSVDKS